MDESKKDIIITNCESGKSVWCLILVLSLLPGTIPGHIGNVTRGRGKIFAFGVLPVNVQNIDAKLAKMGLHS